MRTFIASFFLTLSTTLAQAAISPDALRTLAYSNNIAAVEAALAEAHQESLLGAISYDALRELVVTLGKTHPDMETFRTAWLEQQPNSAYAQTVMAWALYQSSYAIRGDKAYRDTPAMAIAAFDDLQDQAMALARSAYDIAPDFVPASDGVIVMQMTTGKLWGFQIDRVIANTMEVTPNFGSLRRASGLSDRRWGGVGESFNHDLCNAHSAAIPEHPGLTVHACIVALYAENEQFDGNWNFIADVLDRDDHVVLAYAHARRALERGTDKDRAYIMTYLDGITFDDPWFSKDLWIAKAFSNMRYFRPTDETIAFRADLQQRFRDEILAQLEHDPYRLSLLKVGTWESSQISRFTPLRNNEFRNYEQRIAIIQPYHVTNWSTVATHDTDIGIAPFLTKNDTPYVNAIAYSDHNLNMITNYMQRKLSQFRSFDRRNTSATINGLPWPDEDVFYSDVGCRLATLIRLFDDAAERFPEKRNAVDGFRIDHDLVAIEAELRDLGTCDHIWDARISDLRFTPTEIDRHALLTFFPGGVR